MYGVLFAFLGRLKRLMSEITFGRLRLHIRQERCLNRNRPKVISLAQEGEKTPYISRLRFHLTLLGYSDRDVVKMCDFESFILTLIDSIY